MSSVADLKNGIPLHKIVVQPAAKVVAFLSFPLRAHHKVFSGLVRPFSVNSISQNLSRTLSPSPR